MGLHDQYELTQVINARGTFTPLGVSRTCDKVAKVVAEALSGFFLMDELQDLASRTIAQSSGAEAGTVVHCTAAAITLSVAASMTGLSPQRIEALPDTRGMPNAVVLPAGHAVNYGHSILQDIRLAGANPVLSGSDAECTFVDLEASLARPDAACLLLVSSRLTQGVCIPLAEAIALAHRRGIPAIIDGAAQDLRIAELLATGADLVLISGQKYLASPTAGLVIGRADLVSAVRAQEKGIGRAMKASKEAIFGVLAALQERQKLDVAAWQRRQTEKVERFIRRANALTGICATSAPDPTGLPFPRAKISVDSSRAGLDATALAKALETGSPPIWLMTNHQDNGDLMLELVPLTDQELDAILVRLADLLTG
jgi:L-seryl-tRNA(Ser) seleniumtransferase